MWIVNAGGVPERCPAADWPQLCDNGRESTVTDTNLVDDFRGHRAIFRQRDQ